MREVAFSDFSRMKAAEMPSLMPMIVTVNSIPTFLVDKMENIIVLSDLHPRVQHMLRAIENKARMGMPPAVKMYGAARDRTKEG